jgi:two-component sensor histidine kinase
LLLLFLDTDNLTGKILTRLVATTGARKLGTPGKSVRALRLVASEIKSGFTAEPEKIDLGALLIRLIGTCRRQVAPGIVLSLNARLGSGSVIDRNEARTLQFVVCEIVSNAYRYAHPGGAPVEVTIECRTAANGEITIDIGDDGIGLAPDFAEWRDAGDGMVAMRAKLQKIDAILNMTSDDLGLRFQITLHPCGRIRPNPSRGNFVWL